MSILIVFNQVSKINIRETGRTICVYVDIYITV